MNSFIFKETTSGAVSVLSLVQEKNLATSLHEQIGHCIYISYNLHAPIVKLWNWKCVYEYSYKLPGPEHWVFKVRRCPDQDFAAVFLSWKLLLGG